MSIINIDYIRGFVDGEGYIGIRRHIVDNKIYYCPIIKICQTAKNVNILYEIIKFLGGGYLDFSERSKKNPKSDNSYDITFSGIKQVTFFIDKVKHLYIKEPQLNILREFINIDKQYKDRKIIQLEKQRLYDLIISLNKRGKRGAVATTK